MATFYSFDQPISVLIPVCNEGDVIEEVVRDWLDILKDLPKGSLLEFEDANSTDGTLEILRQFATVNSQILVYERDERDGFSRAVKRLLLNAKNDWIFVADSDGQYFAEDIFLHLNKWQPGVDFIKGVKINRHDGFFRRFFSFLINQFIVIYYGFPFLDYNSSHYLISKNLLSRLDIENWFFEFSINMELTLRAILSNSDFRVVYIRHSERKNGVSRGNPPHKFLSYGIKAYKNIVELKKKY